ncbi:hypothetical protein ACMHYB_62045 [Sorangium sp. So ce1128]
MPGIGQVFWDPSTGGNLAPVNVRRLDPNFGDTDAPAPTHDMMAGGYHRWSFGDYRGDQGFSEPALQHANVTGPWRYFGRGSAHRTADLPTVGRCAHPMSRMVNVRQQHSEKHLGQ